MKTVVFHILPTPSHLNASYKLAKSLRSKGHRVIYFSYSYKEPYFRSLGFEFSPYPESQNPLEKPQKQDSILKKAILAYKNKRHYHKEFLKGDFYDELLGQISPDMIVVDLSLIYYSVFLYKKKVPFIITCTKVCLDKSPDVPPFTSAYIPKQGSVVSRIFVYWLWLHRLSLYRFRSLWDHYLTLGKISPYQLCRIYAQKNKLNFKKLANTHRYSHFGWKYIPEVILSPKEFDYPREFAPNQYHIGPVVDMERIETEYDSTFPEAMEKIDRLMIETGKKLVYCAMGSYDFKHRKKRIKFYLKLLRVFENHPELILVLSTGKDINPKGFPYSSTNTFLFQNVPQLTLLKKSSLMINHGGMQSVTECIFSGIPMLSYPLNTDLDQKGNAARVSFHGIGLLGNLKNDSCTKIEEKVIRIIDERQFREKTQSLAEKLNKKNDYKKGITLITEYFFGEKDPFKIW